MTHEKESKEKARKSGMLSKFQIDKEKRAKEGKIEAKEREWTPEMEEDEDKRRYFSKFLPNLIMPQSYPFLKVLF